MNNEFPKVKHKAIDAHLHIYNWKSEEGEDFFHCFEEYKENMGLSAINIAALPSGYGNDVTSNIMCAVYKLINKDTYAHAGLLYDQYPMGERLPEDMDFVTQLNELTDIGFDGIKMIEGKPTMHKKIGKNLLRNEFDRFFSEAEKRKTHIIFHANDPDEFWLEEYATEDGKKRGWFYGDGTFSSYDEIYRQVYSILEKHPKLCVTFAHFFFKSKRPNDLVDMFEKYPNMCVDLTPGWEMYLSFYENREYYKEFFTKFSKRIILGTDSFFPAKTESNMWRVDRVYRFLSSPDIIKAVDDGYEGGLCLPDKAINDITHLNFERQVGIAPKTINKNALKSYYAKYKHLMTNEDIKTVESIFARFL